MKAALEECFDELLRPQGTSGQRRYSPYKKTPLETRATVQHTGERCCHARQRSAATGHHGGRLQALPCRSAPLSDARSPPGARSGLKVGPAPLKAGAAPPPSLRLV